MKKIYLLILMMLGIYALQAKPVTPATAKNVAINFYKQHSTKIPQTVTLAFTETSLKGEALYYVFNVNTNDGFVIITADDVAHPVIGYSTEKQFILPTGNTNISYWMNSRKKEIISIKAANLQATEDITQEWAGNFSSNATNFRQANGLNTVATASVAPLVQSTWNQSPYYNADCPGSTGTGTNVAAAVTGCVATTMSQIMRYWSYPLHGIGASSYTCTVANGFQNNYGVLSANYAATTYSWSAMPLLDGNVNASTDTDIANLMYQCGISVHMNYDPAGSSSYVLTAGAPGGFSAQTSYTAYFGYDQTTIHGYERTQGGYSDAAWLNLIESDLNIGRPVQYAGQDSVEGGHTWVCDGYDVNDNLHMNWGWGGYDDGYYSINNLLTTNGSPGFNPEKQHQILVGIQPPPSLPVAGFTSPSNICATQNVSFTDASTGSPTSWHWKVNPNTGVTITTSSVTSPSIKFNNPGNYTVTETVTNGLGSDSTTYLAVVTACSAITCDTATHIGNTDTLLLYTTGSNTTSCTHNGYFVGTNCYGFTGLAEAYNMSDLPTGNVQVNGAIILFYRKSTSIGTHGTAGNTATTLSLVNSSTNPAAAASATTAITFSDIASATGVNSINYAGTPSLGYASPIIVPYVAMFATPVTVTSNFFMNLTLPSTSGDTVALFSGKQGHNAANTAWVDYGGTWYQFTSIGEPNFALAILPIIGCQTNNTTGITSNYLGGNINLFPNPNNGQFTFAVSLTETTNLNFSVVNTLGQVVYTKTENNILNAVLNCDLSHLAKGIYYANITDSNNNQTIKKIIIE